MWSKSSLRKSVSCVLQKMSKSVLYSWVIFWPLYSYKCVFDFYTSFAFCADYWQHSKIKKKWLKKSSCEGEILPIEIYLMMMVSFFQYCSNDKTLSTYCAYIPFQLVTCHLAFAGRPSIIGYFRLIHIVKGVVNVFHHLCNFYFLSFYYRKDLFYASMNQYCSHISFPL